MKISAVGLLSIFLTAASTAPVAAQQPDQQQTQIEQHACEADVYALCGQAIPDVQRITACLRAHWKDVSDACRTAMANQPRRHKQRRDKE